MVITVNVYEAKTHLSRLLEEVEGGKEIIVARAGRPIAKLTPYRQNDQPRRLGLLAGKVRIEPGFEEYDEQIAAMFDESDPESFS